MRYAGWICALAVAAAGLTTGVALGARGAAPIATVVEKDATGDAGSGPDISSFTATVGADGTLTLAAAIANRSSLRPGESLQFFLVTPAGGSLNIATFDWGVTLLSERDGATWQSVREIQGAWANGTFTTSVTLGQLRDAVHQPVVPSLDVAAGTYLDSSTSTPTRADAAPDSGAVALRTQAAAPPTTTTPPPTVKPFLKQRVVRLAGGAAEWRQLAVAAVPAGAAVSIACTRLCSLSEHLQVAHGVATSTRFVGKPLRRGTTFVVRVLEPAGTGYWFRLAVTGRPAPAAATTSSRGCIAGGKLGGPAGC